MTSQPIASRVRPRGLMTTPGYARLWFAGGVGNAMRWLELLVAGIFTYDLTHSAFLVAVVTVARSLPMLFLGPIAGVIAEAVNRKRLLLAIDRLGYDPGDRAEEQHWQAARHRDDGDEKRRVRQIVGEDPGDQQFEPAHRIADAAGKPQPGIARGRQQPLPANRRRDRLGGHLRIGSRLTAARSAGPRPCRCGHPVGRERGRP